jgi:hypothetical protein
MSQKIFKKGYCSRYAINEEGPWTHEGIQERGFPADIIYNDILEECLRKEFDEKLQNAKLSNQTLCNEVKILKGEVALLKKTLADALEALAQK